MSDHPHVWKSEFIPVTDPDDGCDEHPGLVCRVSGCYEYIDLMWEDDPRYECG